MRHHLTNKKRSGFTLVELSIVLAIAMITLSYGVWMAQDLLPRWRCRAAAMEMSSHIQRCRLDHPHRLLRPIVSRYSHETGKAAPLRFP